MKKVAIVTIQDTNNYGNRLQNYAMQEVLRKMGLEVETLKNNTNTNQKDTTIVHMLKRIKNKLQRVKKIGNARARCFREFDTHIQFASKELREDNAKQFAKNYDYFGTTLTVSPFKNSNKLNEIGLLLEKEYNIKYLVSDFKKKDGYKKSILLSNKYNLYRQDFCGCIKKKKKSICE